MPLSAIPVDYIVGDDMSIPPKRVFCLPSRVCHWPSVAEEDSVASPDVVPNTAGAAGYGGGNAGGESVGGGKSQTAADGSRAQSRSLYFCLQLLWPFNTLYPSYSSKRYPIVFAM